MAQMNISNTLFNDTSTGEIAYVEQLKDRLLRTYIANNPNYSATDKGRIPAALKAEAGVFQEKLNEFFLDHWVDFQRFILDEGVDPTVIDSWKEVQEFLEGLPDDETMWLKNKLTALDTAIAGVDQDGIGTFDVSAYNNTGGVYAQYADLSAALAGVPVASRRSGMAIRFIDSDTQQYEMWQYKKEYANTTAGNTAFTTVSNWYGFQDTDAEPTAGSVKPVQSGGVYRWASNVILGLTSFDLTQHGYYQPSGEFVSNESYRSEKFDIPNGAIWVSIWNYRQSTTERIVFFDSNDNVVYQKAFTNNYVNIKIDSSYTKVAISSVKASGTSSLMRCFFSLTPLLTGMEMVSFGSGEAVSNIFLADSVIINSRDLCRGGAIHKSIQSSVLNETQTDVFTYTQNAYNTKHSVSLTSGKRYRIHIAVTGESLNFQFTGIRFYNAGGVVYTDPTITSAAQLSSCVVDFTPEADITNVGVTFNSAWVGSLDVSVTVNEVSDKFATPAVVSDAISASIWENTHDVLIVHDVAFLQTASNSGYKNMELRAGIEYSVRVISSGEYSGVWNKIIFYSATSASSSVYQSLTQEFTFTPDSNINYFINFYTSDFSGEADVEVIIERVVDRYLKTEDTAKAQQEYDAQIQGLSLNVFGDVLPADFKEKFLYGTDDLLIVCQGDSLTGLTQNCLPALNPSHSCPGGQYQSWVSLLQNQVSKVKPFYNRLDSIRDDAEFFTKIGTWEQATTDTFSPTGDPAIPDSGKESSVTALTFRSSSDDASVSFAFDADNYDKCNIVFTKNMDAGSMSVTIQEGNGKMLASIDRTTWVEANGFTHSQATLTPTSTNGEATCERHRRIWMKKVSGVEGTIHITYAKTDNDESYVYFWGTEMYSGRAILFDNIGRGGRYIALLARNISDVFDRNPDLALLEMPITNDLYHSNTDDEIKAYYNIYFAGNDGRSYKYRSNNFENFPIIVVLPHTRSSFFDDDDNAIMGTTSQQTIRTAPAYCICKMIYGYLWNLLKEYPNVSFINLYDQILNEAKYRFGGWGIGLSPGNLTEDGTHPNQNGANVYAKYLAALFQ